MSGGCRVGSSVTLGCTSGPATNPGPYSQDWPDSCNGISNGTTCETSCIPGYEGALVTQCRGNNSWSAPLGSCKKVTWKCYTLPANPPAGNAYNWPALSNPVYMGGIITAQCAKGYVGTVVAMCLGSNRWSTVKGSCYKNPTSCFGPPPFAAGSNNGGWDIPADQEIPDGSYTQASCSLLRYYVGVVVAYCNRGNWLGPYGSCIPDPTMCRTAPPNPIVPGGKSLVGSERYTPVIQDEAYPHATVIENGCQSSDGYVGWAQVVCINGQW